MDGKHWPKALNRLLLMVQGAVVISGWFCATFVIGTSSGRPLLGLCLALALGILGIFVHEAGHYLAARWWGMPVLSMRLTVLELQARRRGWRLRLRKCLGGYVMAASNLQRSLRGQWLAVAFCGPLLNLLAGLAALGLGLAWPGLSSAVLLGFAAINLALGVANLIPTLGTMPSDGLLLWRWFTHRDDQLAELAYARLLALSVAGATSGQLPQADLEHLDQAAMPQPLVAFSYRLAARQEQGDWAAAQAMEPELERLLEGRAGELPGLQVMVDLLRTELAFCRACQQRDASLLQGAPLTAEVEWYSPWLRPRGQALAAFLDGDRQRGESHLEQVQRLADDSVILSLGKSEALLAGHLRALPGA